ncbi:MAG: fructoselysine 6-kinase [Eubacteriaceae bacterium]|nr:fructoselysine 6-kinase [Eubacteriaceae bacterium]
MKIACVGDNCIDAYDELGEYYPGGNPVNVAVYSSLLGNKASYTGVVGDDEMGKLMICALSGKGVDISHLRVQRGKTAVTHVTYEGTNRIFGEYEEGVMADFKLNEDDLDFLCSADIVVSGIWGKCEEHLHFIHERKVKVAFDFADKLESDIVKRAAKYVDCAFFSHDRDDSFIRDYLTDICKMGAKKAVATLGEKGSIAFDGKNFTVFGIVPCRVVDTLGAGDSYIAGFINSMLCGGTTAECMMAGAKTSSRALGVKGAW